MYHKDKWKVKDVNTRLIDDPNSRENTGTVISGCPRLNSRKTGTVLNWCLGFFYMQIPSQIDDSEKKIFFRNDSLGRPTISPKISHSLLNYVFLIDFVLFFALFDFLCLRFLW